MDDANSNYGSSKQLDRLARARENLRLIGLALDDLFKISDEAITEVKEKKQKCNHNDGYKKSKGKIPSYLKIIK